MFGEPVSQKLSRILKNFKYRNWSCKSNEDSSRRLTTIFHAEILVGGITYALDTVLVLESIEFGNSRNSIEYATFTTFIHSGVDGENVELFDRCVDALNYDYIGKFVRDYTDYSQDILYITSEPLTIIDRDKIYVQLDHHARVKAQVTPELEHLKKRLDLKQKNENEPNAAEKYASTWATSFRQTKVFQNNHELIYQTSELK